jgi:ribosome-binding protein aMBF1 (putative translation factor)
MDGQDWTVVTVKRQRSSGTKAGGQVHATPGSGNLRAVAQSDDIIKPKQMTHAGRTEIIQKRAAMNMTQVQLNQMCRFPTNTMREIEAGRAQPTVQQLSMLNRVLKSAVKFDI